MLKTKGSQDICSDSCVCCRTEMEFADQTFSYTSHSILTLSQPVPALTLYRQVHGKAVTGIPFWKLLVWLDWKKIQGKNGLKKIFFFFCVPQLYLWGSPLLGEIFAYVTVFFFNPTIKVVTFRLCGWCVLGVFLLRAFTRLGHERQDLLSPCDEMHVCTD